jgi:DNA-binding winged helix-turn-helix (wHTH) protein
MEVVGSGIFEFERFRLDRRGGGLFCADKHGAFVPVAIGSRALDVLCVLVQRHGDLVSKEEIMAAVWPGIVVATVTCRSRSWPFAASWIAVGAEVAASKPLPGATIASSCR